MIFKMSDIDQTVTVYKLHPETNEFIGSDNAFIPAHTGYQPIAPQLNLH